RDCDVGGGGNQDEHISPAVLLRRPPVAPSGISSVALSKVREIASTDDERQSSEYKSSEDRQREPAIELASDDAHDFFRAFHHLANAALRADSRRSSAVRR